MQNTIRSWRSLRFLSVLLVLCTLSGALPSAAHNAHTTINTFYTATKSAFDTWNSSSSSPPPPKTSTFPSQVDTIAFYFDYTGATPGSTKYQIVIHDHTGATFAKRGPFPVKYADGLIMRTIVESYSHQTYAADLLIDGKVAASTSFTVGTASSGSGSVSVGVFYPATKAAFDTWNSSTSNARPPKTARFPSGISTVAFYFEYNGAVAKATKYQLIVHDPSGAVFASRGPFTLSYANGLLMRYITAPNNGTYPNGTYSVDVLINKHLTATTSFTVGGQSVSIGIFYPATKSAFDAWSNSTSTDRPPKTVAFPSGTKVVAFYFEYHGAKAKSTQYDIIIRDHSGKTFTSHGPYAFQHTEGLHMSPVDVSSSGAFPNGAYRADLLIDGQTALSVFFTVGSSSTTTACKASDVIATCIEPSILRLHANLPNNYEAEGTGFVIQSDSSGTYLLTNRHVVEGAKASTMEAISPDGNTHYPVLGVLMNKADSGTGGDLAIVKLGPTSLKPLKWGDSEQLHILQQVISIGYGDAFNLPGPPTATEGVISALHRDLQDSFGPVWIQHQSFINHGNSGGPLMDLHYNVVGVNTLSQKQTQGIFFAIPTSLAIPISQKLIQQLQSQ